jgi:hypothetical protein
VHWNWLYRIAGAAALVTAVMIPLQVAVFIIWPPPLEGTAIEWFTLFQTSRLVGLLSLDLLILVDVVLSIPLILALFVTLRCINAPLILLGAALVFIGMPTYFASNTAFNMLALSDQYAAAGTEAQRAALLAAGQAMMAIYQGTAFHLYYVLSSLGLIILTVVMLRSSVYGRAAAVLGILANVVALGLYVPAVGVYISIFSVLFLEIWYILVGLRLLRLGR